MCKILTKECANVHSMKNIDLQEKRIMGEIIAYVNDLNKLAGYTGWLIGLVRYKLSEHFWQPDKHLKESRCKRITTFHLMFVVICQTRLSGCRPAQDSGVHATLRYATLTA